MARRSSQFGLVIAALIFIAISIGVVLGAQRLINNAAWVSHTNNVLRHLEDVQAQLRDGEASMRGYLLTGNVDFLADYRRVRDALPTSEKMLGNLVLDNPEQVKRIESINALIDLRARQMTHTLDAYKNGGMKRAIETIDPNVIATSSEIRRASALAGEVEELLLIQRQASTEFSADILRALALLGIPCGLGVIAFVQRRLWREIKQRTRAEAAAMYANEELRIGVENLEQSSAELRMLSRYGSMLQSAMSPDEAMQLTMRLLSSMLPSTFGAIYRTRNSRDYSEMAVEWGRSSVLAAKMLSPDDCWALRRDQTYVAVDAGDERCAHIEPHDANGLVTACLPLTAQGTQLGLLYLCDDNQGFLARMEIIRSAAEHLSMALSSLYLRDSLRLQSIREPLTGLFNRRYLEESMVRELARCTRRGFPLAVMMLDIDHFKAFNDLYGHAGGDLVLTEFGALLQRVSRTEDIACRYGGEQFTLIMPEADLIIVKQRAEAIRALVEVLRVQQGDTVLPKVTVSIGIAVFPEHGQTPEALLRAADEALYRAKHNGRNRTEQAQVVIKGTA